MKNKCENRAKNNPAISWVSRVCGYISSILLCLIIMLIVVLIVVLFFPNETINFINISTALGTLIALLLFHLRNEAMTAQTESQYKIFNEDKQFSNFLEATKLLTNNDSTTEAKIAAIFSLADVAKAHPERLDRIVQVLNKELIPLIKAIDGNPDTNKYSPTLQEKRIVKKPLELKKETELFSYTQNKMVSYDEEAKTNQEKIKNWQHKGTATEKIVSVTLYVIRKILLDSKNIDSKFDFSNTIFFDIDSDFDKKDIGQKFIRESTRIENAIFLDCKLKNVIFSNTIFHYCSFINCDLDSAKFSKANLWGTFFKNCNLKGVVFDNSKCEGVIFKNCKNLTKKQIDDMAKTVEKIENIKTYFPLDSKSNLKYLIILEDMKIAKTEEENFLTSSEYSKWKNSDKG